MSAHEPEIKRHEIRMNMIFCVASFQQMKDENILRKWVTNASAHKFVLFIEQLKFKNSDFMRMEKK